MRSKSKTSVDILEERNMLDDRVRELEASLVKVRAELDHALRGPEVHVATLLRIDAVVRRALGETSGESALPPLSKTRPIEAAARRAG